jgi:hypothetical protein
MPLTEKVSPAIFRRSIFRWPWSKTEEEKRAEQKAKEERKQAEAKAKEEQKLKKKHEKLMWVPSPTKISLQTMWWGYRMSVNSLPAGSVANLCLSQISPSARPRGVEQQTTGGCEACRYFWAGNARHRATDLLHLQL